MAHDVEPWPGGLPGMSEVELRAMLEALVPGLAREFVKKDEPKSMNDEAESMISNRFIETLVKRADGLPLYVKLVAHEIGQESFTLDQLSNPNWFPASLLEFFDKIATSGPLRGELAEAPLIGCLLVLAKEPLSINEIAALLARQLTPDEAELVRQEYGGDPLKHSRELAERTVQKLAGLLRSSLGHDLEHRFRLLHDDLEKYVLESRKLIRPRSEVRALLKTEATKPGNDSATCYLFRNGIEHIIDGDADRNHGAETAARILAGFDYQLQRLANVTKMGGDSGIREDWTRIQLETIITEEVPRAWRHFWGTDGTLFELGDGRDAARELLERVLEYAPDTIVGSSYGLSSAQ